MVALEFIETKNASYKKVIGLINRILKYCNINY